MPVFRAARPLVAASVLLAVLAACAKDDTAGRVPLGQPAGDPAAAAGSGAPDALPPGMTAVSVALLDSGNVAFRVKQFDVARAFYERAAAEVPTQAAPWYGVYMVAQATKNQPLADSAMQMVSQRSGGSDLMATMGDAHKNGAPGSTGGAGPIPPGAAMPKGHPTVPPQ